MARACEDAMRKAGVAHSKSSKDMESHVFLKAKTRAVPCVCGTAVGGQCVGAQASLLAPLFVPSSRGYALCLG
ncbi:MED15 [Cervus elaphus hippelaphus]|uniref:Mediator of RNA polymerase II transcription subunit 15 n=1 Tax=Cervus elaphus hippelaphus TaxID=46360 RepID=A0A212D8T2_CEREH|nr:MED15 [Cervus elaphus hippelaphus]